MSRITYLIADYDFFTNQYGGKISHALGIIKGYTENNIKVNFVCGNKSPDENFDNVELFKVHTSNKMLNKIKIIRNLNYLHKAFKKISELNSDYILIRKNIYILIYFYLSLGFKFTGIDSRKIIWEVNGLSLETIKEKNIIGKILYGVFSFLNKIMLVCGAGVYVVSKKIKDELTVGIVKCKENHIVTIENGAPEAIDTEYSKDSNNINLVFFGVFRPYNDYDIIAKSLNSSSCNVTLNFIGYGPCQKQIDKLSIDNKNIINHGKMSRKELSKLEFMTHKTFGIIPMKKNFSSSFLSPIKLYEYTSLGLPVLISDAFVGEPNSDAIFKYNSDSDESLIELINKLSGQDYSYLRECAYEYAKNNSWSKRMNRLHDFSLQRV